MTHVIIVSRGDWVPSTNYDVINKIIFPILAFTDNIVVFLTRKWPNLEAQFSSFPKLLVFLFECVLLKKESKMMTTYNLFYKMTNVFNFR